MIVLGSLLVLVFALIALGVTGLMLWSGWLAVQDELRPDFKRRPPGPRTLSLTLIGVILPVIVIAVFTLYLAVVLVQTALGAL